MTDHLARVAAIAAREQAKARDRRNAMRAQHPELASFVDKLRGAFGADDIRSALAASFDHYPDFPPTLPQFVGLCRDARRVRAAGATKLPTQQGVPCPPEIKAQIDAFLKRTRA